MKWLKYLLGFSAVLVAGCAAYFSVTGLAILFSGAYVAVIIMASALEIAKLVSATYLKQQWNVIKGANKWYLTIAVTILMLITSAGIFGFLSNAFQQQNIKLDQVQREITVWETKIKSNEQLVGTLTVQLTDLQSNQGKIIDKGNVNRSLLRSVDNRDKQIQRLQDKISGLQDSILTYNQKINDIKNENIGIEREIGGFRFVAESFNLPLNTVVKFFIILIVFVFDPLAIALVIAFNQLIMVKRKEEDEEPTHPKEFVDEVSRVRLSDDDIKKLEEILLNPPAPNDALKKVKENYDNVVNNENAEEEYVPTKEEDEKNFQEVIKNMDDEKIISTNESKSENIFQEEKKN